MKNNKTILWCVVLLSLLSCLVSASPQFFVKQNSERVLHYYCAACDLNYSCNVTLESPTGGMLLIESTMNKSGRLYNVSLSAANLADSGDYNVWHYCGNGTGANYSSYYFTVNESGKQYIGFNLVGVYIILAVICVLFLYSSFQLNKINIIPRILLFGIGLAQIVFTVLISYLDYMNINISSFLLILFVADLLVLFAVLYLLIVQVLQDVADLSDKQEDDLI